MLVTRRSYLWCATLCIVVATLIGFMDISGLLPLLFMLLFSICSLACIVIYVFYDEFLEGADDEA